MLRFYLLAVVCIFGQGIKGCRQKCEGERGISEKLRPFFIECLGKKLGARSTWKYLVNYVVFDDIWFQATDEFYCNGKNATCWIDQLGNLLKPTSYLFSSIEQCIGEYPGDSDLPCDIAENPVFQPRIVQKFNSMLGCPLSPQNYLSCLTSSAISQTFIMQVLPGQKMIRPIYNFAVLSPFLNYQRANCRVSKFGSAYVTSCIKPKEKTVNGQPAVSTRQKRAFSLKDLLNQTTGRINLRLSGTGVATILPSDPLKTKVQKAPRCFAQKLQMVIKARTVLSTAASRCNKKENEKRSTRVSTSFIVARVAKKQPGQVGTCKSDQSWSKWFNTDNPSEGTGDLEYFSRIRRRTPRDVCIRPTAVQALVAKNNRTYTSTLQEVKIGPIFGLSCHNYKQKNRKCEDYKVRFCCK